VQALETRNQQLRDQLRQARAQVRDRDRAIDAAAGNLEIAAKTLRLQTTKGKVYYAEKVAEYKERLKDYLISTGWGVDRINAYVDPMIIRHRPRVTPFGQAHNDYGIYFPPAPDRLPPPRRAPAIPAEYQPPGERLS